MGVRIANHTGNHYEHDREERRAGRPLYVAPRRTTGLGDRAGTARRTGGGHGRRRSIWRFLPLLRAIGVLSAVGVATTLVTFAALQSNGAALAGNTIQTATASLQISRDGDAWGDSAAGFTFSGLVPGGQPQPAAGYAVHLKNTGLADLQLSLTVPAPPDVAGNVDLSQVSVLVTRPGQAGLSGPSTQTIALSDLIAGPVGLDSGYVHSGGTIMYTMQVAMTASALHDGSGATISNLDLSFSGAP